MAKTTFSSHALLLLALSSSLALASGGGRPTPNPNPNPDPGQNNSITPIRVMEWNVENLHDTVHNDGKDDWAFLPMNTPGKKEACAKMDTIYRIECYKGDWTEARLAVKLDQISRVVNSLDNRHPQILALEEVESELVVSQLTQKLGYQHYVTTHSPDGRGMNVALLFDESSQLKFVASQEHVVVGKNQIKPTRNILQADFKLGTQDLSVFVNHWPSQAAPAPARADASQTLAKAIQDLRAGKANVAIVSLGDYNVTSEDQPDPFAAGITDPSSSGALWDLDTAARDSKSTKSLPDGTYFYPTKAEWNTLDHAFLSENLRDGKGLDLDLSTYEIVHNDFQMKSWTYRTGPLKGTTIQIPKRSDFLANDGATMGFSDHMPITFLLKSVGK